MRRTVKISKKKLKIRICVMAKNVFGQKWPKKQNFYPKKCFETFFLVGLSQISLFLIKINCFKENEKVFSSLYNYPRMVGRGFFKRGHVNIVMYLNADGGPNNIFFKFFFSDSDSLLNFSVSLNWISSWVPYTFFFKVYIDFNKISPTVHKCTNSN